MTQPDGSGARSEAQQGTGSGHVSGDGGARRVKMSGASARLHIHMTRQSRRRPTHSKTIIAAGISFQIFPAFLKRLTLVTSNHYALLITLKVKIMDWTPQHQNLTKQFSDIIGATDDDVTVILDVLAVVTADLMIEKVPAFDRSEAVKGFVRRFIQAEQTISIRKLMAEG